MLWRLARAGRSPPALGLRAQRLARPQRAPSRSWDPIRVLMTLNGRVAVARELLRERWGDAVDSKTYIVVQKPFMLYRSFATFSKQWPGPSFAVASPAVASASSRGSRTHHGSHAPPVRCTSPHAAPP